MIINHVTVGCMEMTVSVKGIKLGLVDSVHLIPSRLQAFWFSSASSEYLQHNKIYSALCLTHFQAVKETHPFFDHCIKVFCRALQNTAMADRDRLRQFNSSGTALLGPRDAPPLETMKELRADDDLIHFISSIYYSINISITAPVKAEVWTSASQDRESAQVLAHHTRVTDSAPASLVTSSSTPSLRGYAMWWSGESWVWEKW